MPFEINLNNVNEHPSSPLKGNKRPRDATDDEESSIHLTPMANSNVLTLAKRFAASKKLRPDQMTEVESFLNVSNQHLLF